MSTRADKNIPDLIAKIASVLFHPLFMVVYGLAIILSPLTPFGYLPFTVKRLIFLIIVVNNVFLPLSLLPFLMQMRIISSWTLSERKERYIPLIITTVLYSTTSYIIFRFPIPFFLKSFLYATFFVSLIVSAINFRFRISLHSVGAGGFIAILMLLCFKMYMPPDWHLILGIIAGGLVLSSRLRLNVHSPSQVWWGFFTGFSGLMLFMLILQKLA